MQGALRDQGQLPRNSRVFHLQREILCEAGGVDPGWLVVRIVRILGVLKVPRINAVLNSYTIRRAV